MRYTKSSIYSIVDGNMGEYKGYLFKYMLDDTTVIDLGVYKEGDKWCVIDPTIGLTLCVGTKRQTAVNKAFNPKFVKKFTEFRNSEQYTETRGKFLALECFMTEKVEKTATEVSLSGLLVEMQEWCKTHENTIAERKDGEMACVRVLGVRKKDTDTQKELKELGFRWSRDKGFWFYGTQQAKKQGKVATA